MQAAGVVAMSCIACTAIRLVRLSDQIPGAAADGGLPLLALGCSLPRPPDLCQVAGGTSFWLEVTIFGGVPLSSQVWEHASQAVAGAFLVPTAEGAAGVVVHSVADFGLPYVGVLAG